MTLKSDAKFDDKLTCGLESDMRNLANFHQSTWKSQIRTLMGSFNPKWKMQELKIYRRVMCHDNEEWRKIEEELTCRFIIDVRINLINLINLDPEHSKVSKICTLMGSFWSRYIMFEIKKYRGVMFNSPEDWCKMWIKTDLYFQKWHEEFGKFSQAETFYLGNK